MIKRVFIGLCCLLLISCATRKEQEYAPLYDWSKTNFSVLPTDDEILEGCLRYVNKRNNPGQIIGCQQTEVFDVRNPELQAFTKRKLGEQSCVASASAAGNRFYVRTNRHFFFLDKQLRTFWYVPAGYYSDGVSIPDSLLLFLPGPVWDPATPKTLPAALVHDRYLCLRTKTFEARKQDKELALYRRKSCTNTAFENNLKTSGTANTVGALMYTAVSLANREPAGYCPKRQYDDVAALEQRLGRDMPALAKPQRDLPNCYSQEPSLLCLSNIKNLDHLAQNRGTIKVSDDWRAVFNKFSCLEKTATASHKAKSPPLADQAYCDARDIDFTQSKKSPFRAGDLWIESSGLLAREDMADAGPQKLLQVLAPANNIDTAIDLLIKWNKENPAPK